jgi:uncharacterized protein (DUF302 family)
MQDKMQENPVAALDLPLKVIAREDAHQQVWLAHNEATSIRERYSLPEKTAALLNIEALIEKMLRVQ